MRIKKLMAVAATSVAMLAAASPAFADTSVQVLDASQFQSAGLIRAGDANAAAGAGNSLGIYQA